jgi:Fe-Mn family superoxide dismutase
MKNTRRDFIEKTLKVAAITTLGVPFVKAHGNSIPGKNESGEDESVALQFSQIKLPYEYGALEPYIDAQTMEIHYSKHQAAYVKNVNEAITSENASYGSEKDFFTNTSKLSAKLRNNGGGVWNHNFFWTVMKPASGNALSGKALDAINAGFGSLDKFKEQFTQAAMTRFGSGWAWLVTDNGKLKIGSTANQDNPLMDNSELKGTPVLALDVWEHAYYLKYQNKRNEYVANWWNVVNWDEVAKKLS